MSSAAAAWHPDPSGRHQFRWWDGVRWSDQVADGGVVSVEALPPPATTSAAAQAVAEAGPGGPASPEAAAPLLGLTKLHYRSGGGNFPAGWWQVTDEHRVPIAKVWRTGRTNTLCDLQGAAVLGASAGVRTFGVGGDRDRQIGDLQIVDGAGGRLSPITFIQMGTSMNMRCRVGDEAKMLTVKMKRSPSGAVKSVELLDRSKHQVGAITQLERDGNVLQQGTCWLALERDPDLVEPVRSLAIAAPLLMSSYMFVVGG